MKKKNRKLVGQNLKLVSSNLRHMEMFCEIIFPNKEQENVQGTIRDCLKSMASAIVSIAEIVEK